VRLTVPFGVCVVVALTGCGRSNAPLSPTLPQTTSAPASSVRIFQGQTTSAADALSLGGISVQLGTLQPITSDASGFFSVENAINGVSGIVLTGSSIVERRTDVRVPSDAVVRFGLIPSSFDLPAFNEMFRGSHDRLQRWTTAPSLVVLTTVLKFENSDAASAEATGEQMPAAEIEALIGDLTEGLATLTANTFTAFGQVTRESTNAGSRANLTRNNQIVVARFRDMRATTGSVGFGRWAERDDGVVTAGAMFLDSNYDGTSEKRKLRTHELGHALGYKHVTLRPSIMNPVLGIDVSDFDRQGASIAFQRPVGNRAPDTDPATSVRSLRESGAVRWAPPVP
jgi:hypothetical protein